MFKELIQNRKIVHFLMVLQVTSWGLEYVVAKNALNILEPFTLTFFKYAVATLILIIVRVIKKQKYPLKKKHIITLILCALFGEVLYFVAEYTAMDFLPVSVITIILAFVPVLSIIIEAFLYKRKANTTMVIGIMICILGVGMIIGIDVNVIFSGKWVGYLLAFSMVVSWNLYNFITEKMSGDYKPFDLAFMQISTSALLTLPFAAFNLPAPEDIDIAVIGGVLFLAIGAGCVGFLIYVTAIGILGPTTCALYSNFLPISAALFGWIFLGEVLSLYQILGGFVVITSAAVVIWQKGKLDTMTVEVNFIDGKR